MENRYELKIVIIGDREAGRTSLACLLAKQAAKKDRSGITIYFKNLIHEGKKISLNIWDFSGKEILFSTHSIFFTSRTIYLLVDDTRKDDSYYEDESFKNWFEVVKNYSKKSPLLIVQNEKGGRSKQIDLPGIQRIYPFVYGVYQTNLLTGFGIEKVLDGIMIHGLPVAYQNTDYSWRKVIKSLKSHARNFDYIQKEDFWEICKKRGIPDHKVLHLTEYLNNLGHIVSYHTNPYLKGWIVLNGNWIVNSIYNILESKRINNQYGYFSQNDIEEILYQSEYRNKLNFIIEIMKKFLLCYEVSDKKWIAPQLIKVESPDLSSWMDSNKKMIIAEYPFLPPGFISQLLVRIIKEIDLKEAWQTGIIFDYKGVRCLIRERWGEKKIEIKSNAENGIVRFCYKNLIELSDFHRVVFDLLLPCNCDTCLHLTTPKPFSYKDLLNRYESNVSHIECSNSYEKVEVKNLLHEYNLLQEEKTSTPIVQDPPEYVSLPNLIKKMKKSTLLFLALIFIAGVFLIWARPGSKLDLLGLTVEQGSNSNHNDSQIPPTQPTVTVVGSVKINNYNAWSEDVKRVYIKDQTLGGQNTLSNNKFVLRDVHIKPDKIIEVAIDLKSGLSNSEMFKLPTPDKDNVCDLGEVLIEVKPDSPKKRNSSKSNLQPQFIIINNNIQNNATN